MALVNFGEMTEDVKNILENEGSVHWSDEDVEGAINDGLEELSDGAEFFERTCFFNVIPYSTYHDLRTIVPDVALRVTSIYSPTRNAWLVPSTVRELDEKTARQWGLVQGEPQRWLVRGLFWIGLFPFATSEDRVLQLRYRGLHPRMTDPTEVPQQLPLEYHRAIVSFAVYDLLSDDAETSKALKYWSDYASDEREFAGKRVAARLSRPRRGRFGIV